MCLRKQVCHNEIGNKGFTNDFISYRVGIRSSVILLPILGITWIFGFLTFNSDTIAFKYIFAITNSLQVRYFFILPKSRCFQIFKKYFINEKFNSMSLQYVVYGNSHFPIFFIDA